METQSSNNKLKAKQSRKAKLSFNFNFNDTDTGHTESYSEEINESSTEVYQEPKTSQEPQTSPVPPVSPVSPAPPIMNTTERVPKSSTEIIEDRIRDDIRQIKAELDLVMYLAGNVNVDKEMLIVSTCLLGLKNKAFKSNFLSYTKENIITELLKAVNEELKASNIGDGERKTMMSNFETLEKMEALQKDIEIQGRAVTPIMYILSKIRQSSINETLEAMNIGIDIMGEFYAEFTSHSGNTDDRNSGFVITPRHICELFTELGNINSQTHIVDVCFGTGSFLVSALQRAVALSNTTDTADTAGIIQSIKENNLCGVELDGSRFTYGCVNMILRGSNNSTGRLNNSTGRLDGRPDGAGHPGGAGRPDGAGHLGMIKGDCFASDVRQRILDRHCTVGFINPPYSLKTMNEFKFIENMLDVLEPGGTGIAIIPTSCAGNKNKDYRETRERILRKHTLEAVLSMPEQLFQPAASTVTCIMVFTAHKPHGDTKETWFANCKDDGMKMDRTVGSRQDVDGRWQSIKKKWIEAFRSREEIPEFSLKRTVTADDTWTYESNVKTSYEGLTDESFKKVIKEYLLFMLSQTDVSNWGDVMRKERGR